MARRVSAPDLLSARMAWKIWQVSRAAAIVCRPDRVTFRVELSSQDIHGRIGRAAPARGDALPQTAWGRGKPDANEGTLASEEDPGDVLLDNLHGALRVRRGRLGQEGDHFVLLLNQHGAPVAVPYVKHPSRSRLRQPHSWRVAIYSAKARIRSRVLASPPIGP